MEKASIEIAARIRAEIEAGILPEGASLHLSERAPNLTYQQRMDVINALRRHGYATNDDAPARAKVPLAVKYAKRLRLEVLPEQGTGISLSVPLLVWVLGRDEHLPLATQEAAIRQALLILQDEGLVCKYNRKFFRVV